MGCCSSTDKPHGTSVEDIPLKAKQDARSAIRPASGTVKKDGSPVGKDHDSSRSTTPRNSFIEPPEKNRKGKSKPPGLSIPDRHMDPNALNITPQNAQVKADNQRKHEEDLNKTAMFIPWEKPALGAKKGKPPKLGQRRSSKGGKRKSVSKKKTDAAADQCFIPGTGNEKILMAKGPSIHPAVLPPLSFNNVKATKEVKSAIEADRQKVKEEKARIKAISSYMKEEFGFDNKICKLIKQYAEITTAKKEEKFVILT